MSGLGSIRIEIPAITKTLNQTSRMHFAARRAYRNRLCGEIKLAAAGRIPAAPWPRARVTIWRHAHGTPDTDGLIGGLKELIDCLIWSGKPHLIAGKLRLPHPSGLGFVLDDKPACLELAAHSVRIPKAEPVRTVILIEQLAP